MPTPERETFPRAIVPEHLTVRTLANLPPDEPATIPLFQDTWDYHDRPTLLVDNDRSLRARLSTEIPPTQTGSIKSPLGRAGIMRIALIGDDTVRTGTVTDLRFIKKPIFELDSVVPDDVEEARDWLKQYEESVAIDAFIANDPNSHNGVYYGPAELYPALDRLRKHGNQALRSFQRNSGVRGRRKPSSHQKSPARQSSSTNDTP